MLYINSYCFQKYFGLQYANDIDFFTYKSPLIGGSWRVCWRASTRALLRTTEHSIVVSWLPWGLALSSGLYTGHFLSKLSRSRVTKLPKIRRAKMASCFVCRWVLISPACSSRILKRKSKKEKNGDCGVIKCINSGKMIDPTKKKTCSSYRCIDSCCSFFSVSVRPA